MRAPILLVRFYQSFRLPVLIGMVIAVIGTYGYWIISEYKASLLDCLYMTFITVATIGYGEVVDLSASPNGRIFTMVLGTVGIANVAYTTSKLTAFILESEINEVLRRRRMQERIDAMTGHYIVCGIGRVGTNVAHELWVTGRKFVAIEASVERIEEFRDKYPDVIVLHGDAQDDELLVRAGVARAAGVFAVTGDDGGNVLITLSAKQLGPQARLVARCHEVRNIDKLKRVGADAIVSPDFTGGMRIASSMIRPTVVSFLDEMLRSDQKLRVEEVTIPEGFTTRGLAEVAPPSRDYIVLAVRAGERWEFNPAENFRLAPGCVLVVMAHTEGREALERRVAA
ncbi:MAG: potassium channel protein [Betaproteobacteria bacterium]|nr:potassium channel protein [Betaproteobacteria bacterium]